MIQYVLNFSVGDSLFLLPTRLIDEFLPNCDEISLKVLLYLIRHSHSKIEQEDILSHLHITAAELEQAITYWCATDLMSAGGETPASRRSRKRAAAEGTAAAAAVEHSAPKPAAAKTSTGQAAAPAAPGPRHLASDTPPRYTTDQVTAASAGDDTLRSLLNEVQHLMGKVLSSADITTLFGFYDWLGLPAEVIVMLISYCTSRGIKTMRGMEKVAIEWADHDVTSLERAEEYIESAQQKKELEYAVMKLMGISSRSLTAKEKGYIAAWGQDMGFSLDVIAKAYEITINNTGKISFPYTNSILKSWHEKGYRTVRDVEAKDKKPLSAAKQNKPSYDIDKYMRSSWNMLHKDEKGE